jgi:2-methylisocitrate lyase-like PEP mutase family enzyme
MLAESLRSTEDAVEQRRARLRRRLSTGPILVAPGAHDALTVLLVERAGFEAVYFSGAGLSYTLLARRDMGLLTMSEMAERVAYVAAATRLPVIADADTGYGGEENVARTVRAYARAGAAALQIEDQEWPKRCGHLEGKRLVPVDEMVARIRAACAARPSPDFLVIARTDARAVEGLDAAIARAASLQGGGRRRPVRRGPGERRRARRDQPGAARSPHGEHGRGRAHTAG